jgi:hypothetical protein
VHWLVGQELPTLVTNHRSLVAVDRTVDWVRWLLSALSGRLRGGAHEEAQEIEQLKEVIADYQGMAYRRAPHHPVEIDVQALAFRLRERKRNVIAAVALLERDGRVTRVRSRPRKMRVQSEKDEPAIGKDADRKRA